MAQRVIPRGELDAACRAFLEGTDLLTVLRRPSTELTELKCELMLYLHETTAVTGLQLSEYFNIGAGHIFTMMKRAKANRKA